MKKYLDKLPEKIFTMNTQGFKLKSILGIIKEISDQNEGKASELNTTDSFLCKLV